MPRRRSYDNDDDDNDDMQPVRRSQRVSTQRDNGHHLNYDQKSHPMDRVLRPTLYRNRQLAHGIPVKRPIEIHGSDSEVESEVYDEDDIPFRDNSVRKRRRTSSTVSKSRAGRPRGQRCSTLSDVDRIAKDYQNAWEKTVIDLTPIEAIEVQKSQYEIAWATLATQYNKAADDDDDDEEVEDDNGAGLEELPGFVFSTAAQNEAEMTDDPQLGLDNGGINDEMFISQHSQLPSSQHRSPASIAESLQDELDGHGEDAEVHVPPVVHAIEADRSFTPRVATPAARRFSGKIATPRKNKEVNIVIHEDDVARRTEAWAQRNLVMAQHAFHDDPKENNNDDEEAEGEDEDVDGTTLIDITRPPTTIIQKSFEAPTVRQELQKRAPPKPKAAADDVGDDDTVADEDEDEDEADESSEDGSSDGDERQDSDSESSPRKVKDEPVSSSAACRR